MPRPYICPFCQPGRMEDARRLAAGCEHCQVVLNRACPACQCELCRDPETQRLLNDLADEMEAAGPVEEPAPNVRW